MEQKPYLSYFLKLIQSSIQILEERKLENKNLKNDLKNVKFKLLHNTDKTLQKNLEVNIDSRKTLKTLYFLNFEQPLTAYELNKINFNVLSLLRSNINKYTTIISQDQILQNIYSQTFGISLLYKLYKIKLR